jgi:hypothetical protein
MPVIVMRFRLPDEQDDFEQARMAPKYASALSDFYQWTRNRHKHGGEAKDPQHAYDECFEEFMRLCREHGFDPLTGLP